MKRLALQLLISSVLLLPAAAETFRIGVVSSLTGPAADFGVSIQRSINFAIRDNPENFKHIEFLHEDASYDTKLAVNAFRKLVHQDKVSAVLTWGLSFCRALAPIAEVEQIPLFAECLDPHAAKERPHVIRFFSYSDEFMSVQARWLDELQYKRIALIVSDTAYLQEMADALRRNLSSTQRIVVEEHVLPSDNDLRTAIQRAARSEPDVVGVMLSTGQIGEYYKQANRLHVSVPTVGTNWYESLNEIARAGGLMEGAIFVSTSVTPEFLKRYEESYANPSGLAFAAPAYEFAALVGELFGSSRSIPSSAEILRAFSAVSERSGTAIERVRYVESAQVGKYFQLPVARKVIRQGKIQELGSVSVGSAS